MDRFTGEEVAGVFVPRTFRGQFGSIADGFAVASGMGALLEPSGFSPLRLMQTGPLFEGGDVWPASNSVGGKPTMS